MASEISTSVLCVRCLVPMVHALTFTVVWKGSTLWTCWKCGAERILNPGEAVAPPQDMAHFAHGSWHRYKEGCRCEMCCGIARLVGAWQQKEAVGDD